MAGPQPYVGQGGDAYLAQFLAAEKEAATTAPFDGDGRPDRFHSFAGAPGDAEIQNLPRSDRAQRLGNLRS